MTDLIEQRYQELKLNGEALSLLRNVLENNLELDGILRDFLRAPAEKRWLMVRDTLSVRDNFYWKALGIENTKFSQTLSIQFDLGAVEELARHVKSRESSGLSTGDAQTYGQTRILKMYNISRVDEMVDSFLESDYSLSLEDKRLLHSILFQMIFSGTPEYDAKARLYYEYQDQQTPEAKAVSDLFILSTLNKLLIAEAVDPKLHHQGFYRRMCDRWGDSICTGAGQLIAAQLNRDSPEMRAAYKDSLAGFLSGNSEKMGIARF